MAESGGFLKQETDSTQRPRGCTCTQMRARAHHVSTTCLPRGSLTALLHGGLSAPRSRTSLAVHKKHMFPKSLQKTIIDGDTVPSIIRINQWSVLEDPGLV